VIEWPVTRAQQIASHDYDEYEIIEFPRRRRTEFKVFGFTITITRDV